VEGALVKILIITNMPAPHQVNLFDALGSLEGVGLTVVYTRRMSAGRHWDPPDQLRHDNIFLPEVRLKGHWYLNQHISRLLQLIRNADLVIVGQYASLSMQIAMYYCSLIGKPWIFWSEAVSGVEYNERPLLRSEFLRRWFRKLALFPVRRWPVAYWAVGEKAKCSFVAELPRSKNHCVVYPYYSDLSDFFSIQRTGFPGKQMVFLFSGSLIYRKGFDLVVDAVRVLDADGYSNFKLLVIGVGGQRDLVEDKYKKYFDFRGFVKGDELIQCYKNAEVCLCPSRYDGWGMSLVEALAAGLPVIFTYGSGAAIEILRDASNGWLLAELTAKELAASMKNCLDNRNLIGDMAIECRRSVERYHLPNGVAKFIGYVQSIRLDQ